MMIVVSWPFISCILLHRPQNCIPCDAPPQNCIPCDAPATKDYHDLQLTPGSAVSKFSNHHEIPLAL